MGVPLAYNLAENYGETMRFSLFASSLALAVSTVTSFAVAAPDAALVGKWHGTLENYSANEDHGRDLIVSKDGSCKWGFTNKAGAASCAFGQDGQVTVTTTAQRPSKVELTLKDGQLIGAFTRFQSLAFYRITMSKALGK